LEWEYYLEGCVDVVVFMTLGDSSNKTTKISLIEQKMTLFEFWILEGLTFSKDMLDTIKHLEIKKSKQDNMLIE
jgi:hypothetical protein